MNFKKKLNSILICSLLLSIFSLNALSQSSYEKYKENGIYRFDSYANVKVKDFEKRHKFNFGLGVNDKLKVATKKDFENGKFARKFKVYHKGIPVEGAMMNVLGKKGSVEIVNGFWLKGLNRSTDNLISTKEAIEKAIEYVDADEYIWEAEKYNTEKEEYEDLYPNAKLIFAKKRGEAYAHSKENYELCYTVPIRALLPNKSIIVYVNAKNGDIFTEQEAFQHAFQDEGRVATRFDGTHEDISARTCGFCSKYWLHDFPRNIYTTDWDRTFEGKGSYNKDNNNNWVESDTKDAATAHWGVQIAYDYYLTEHDRWGSDFNGRRIHVGTNKDFGGMSAAFEANSVDNEEDDLRFSTPLMNAGQLDNITSLDIIAHELTHAYIASSSGIGETGGGQPRALNEGFCDIFGVIIKRNTLGTQEWSIGEKTTFPGTPHRNLDYPHNDTPRPSPEIYLESGYWLQFNRIHENGGVIRKWFYLLSEGGLFNGQQVDGIGISAAADLAHVLMTWWLWSGANYPFTAQQSIYAAIYEYGNCSQQHIATAQAMRAVGFNVQIPSCKTISDNDFTQTSQYQSMEVNNEVSVYPNPSNGIFVIENPVISKDWNVKIYNINGDLVHSVLLNAENLKIDLAHLPSTYYILKLESENIILTKKISFIK